MIDWPEDLVLDVARRRCVLYLGAGVSMNSKNAQGTRPKSWAQLLETASRKTGGVKSLLRRLLKEKDYLTACEIIKAKMGNDEYITFLSGEFLSPAFQPAAIHETIFKLDASIVATSNIDKIYETHANHLGKGSVKVKHYYDDDVADALRRPNPIVLKVHGTIDSPKRMIFTRSEYASARVLHSHFYSILDALAVTHTFVFIGCGISDPDIRLVLENYTFRYRDSRRHYIVLPSTNVSDEEIDLIEYSMNLKVLPYSANKNHKELLDSLKELQAQVEAKREELAQSYGW